MYFDDNDPTAFASPPGDTTLPGEGTNPGFAGSLDNSNDDSGGATLPGSDVQAAAANDPSATDDGAGTKVHTMGLPDGGTPPELPGSSAPPAPDSSPTESIYDAIVNAQGGTAPSGSPTEGIYDAIVKNQGGTPASTVSLADTGTTPNAAASGGPTNATASTPTLPGSGAGGALSDADWAARFKADNGYYNPDFNSREDFLANAQRGDQAIRGVTGGSDQLADMAKYDSDAKRIYDAIHGTPDFYQSQNAADWITGHNQQVLGQERALGAGAGGAQTVGGQGYNGGLGAPPSTNRGAGANIAAMDALRRQEIAPVANPIDNAHALMTDQMRTGVQNALDSLGATNIKQSMDPYGNLTLDWVSKSGTPMSMKESLVNYANALEQLKGMAAPPAANPAAAGGGSPSRSAPRSFAPPRGGGGGGGYAPPQAPQAPAPAAGGIPAQPGVAPNAFGYVSETGGGGYPSVFGNQPFNNAGKQAFPEQVRPFNVPGGVNY